MYYVHAGSDIELRHVKTFKKHKSGGVHAGDQRVKQSIPGNVTAGVTPYEVFGKTDLVCLCQIIMLCT